MPFGFLVGPDLVSIWFLFGDGITQERISNAIMAVENDMLKAAMLFC